MLDIIDSQGELERYLNELDIKTYSDVTLNYPVFIKKCGSFKGKLANEWNGVVKTVNKVLGDKFPSEKVPISVFVEGYDEQDARIGISKLRNTHVGKIVVLEGIIRKASESKEKVVKSAWECLDCNMITDTDNDKPPKACGCGKKKFKIVPERCLYRDIQFVSLQEAQAVGSRQPKQIRCRLSGSMIDSLQVGARCTITGIVKVDIDNDEDLIGTTWIDVIGLEKSGDDIIDLEITDEDRQEIIKLSQNPDVYKLLGESINTSVWGYDEIKIALVLQLFGGVSADLDNGERVRGDSHILLVGDPSLAKSQLIRSVAKIIPNCVYSSGKSSSAAGLTVAAVRDEITGQWTLEAGALVLANGAFCVIDELDKMSADDRSALHESLESQTISVAKAGISQTLKTACPVLCAANPRASRFIPDISYRDQINLPDSLLSRFDLVFLLVDKPDPENDAKVASRILDVSNAALEGKVTRPVSIELFRKYIKLAKQYNPKLTEDVKDFLKKEYVRIRLDSHEVITPRQLGALVRLTQSAARVQLRKECTMENAKLSLELFKFSEASVTLGKTMDESLIVSSTNTDNMSEEELRIFDIKCKIRNILTENGKLPLDKMVELAEKQGMDKSECHLYLDEMIFDHDLKYEKVNGVRFVWV